MYICPVDQGEGGCFLFFPHFGDTSIFFLSFFGGFFLGKGRRGREGGCICRLMCGVGLGKGIYFLNFFLANYCAEDLIGCGTVPLAKFYFLFFKKIFFNYFIYKKGIAGGKERNDG